MDTLSNPANGVCAFAPEMVTGERGHLQRTEMELLHRTLQYEAVLENIADGIVVADSHGQILRVNAAIERMFGWERAELIGSPVECLIPEALRSAHVQLRENLQYTTRSRKMGSRGDRLRARTKSGEEFPVDIEISMHQLPSACETLVLLRDLRNDELVENTLRLSAIQTQASSQAKRDFLANMSHELRTPLHGIVGLIDLVLMNDPDPLHVEYLELARESATSLATLLSDIMDVSALQSGRYQLVERPFSLRACLKDTISLMMPLATAGRLSLVSEIDPDVPDSMNGDYVRLRQILTNLLSNAIRFTREGTVQLNVKHAGDGERLEFSVTDTGVGIPQEVQGDIYELFHQGDNSPSRRHGGVGLGLHIVSRLVELMGGMTWLNSRVGVGSSFHFTARLLPAQQPPLVASPQQSGLPADAGSQALSGSSSRHSADGGASD